MKRDKIRNTEKNSSKMLAKRGQKWAKSPKRGQKRSKRGQKAARFIIVFSLPVEYFIFLYLENKVSFFSTCRIFHSQVRAEVLAGRVQEIPKWVV